MKRILIISLFLTGLAKTGFSNTEITVVNNIFNLIYNQQFGRADSVLQMQTDRIDSFYFNILNVDLHWWKHICSGTETDSRQFLTVLKSLENKQKDSPENKITQLVMLSYKMRFELKRYNIFGAVLLRSDIKKILTEVNPLELNYSNDHIKLFYLYQSLFDYFDNILNPLFRESKREIRSNALHRIEKYTNENDLIVSTLANYFLGKIYLNIEKNPQKGNFCFRELTERFPGNEIFSELLKDSELKS